MVEDEVNRDVRVDLVFNQEVERLQRIAVGMGLSADEGEDMLQDVYLKILNKPPKCRETGEAQRWLLRVAVNRCVTELRWRVRHEKGLRNIGKWIAEQRKTKVGPVQELLRHEEKDAITQGLRSLNQLLRAPLVLKYYCGLNASEIAQVLELKPGTVRKRLCDGRMAVANVLLQKGIKP